VGRLRKHRALVTVAILLVVAGLGGLTGCGKKGDPLPPQIRRADTTRDLGVYQEGREAVLDWSYPSVTTAGGPLPDLERIELWRAPIPFGQEPVGSTARERALRFQLLEAQGERIADMDDAAMDAATRGPKLFYRDDLDAWRKVHGAEQQVVLWYSVRAICCGGRVSDFSNIARLVPQLPPSSPEGLRAVPERAGMRLSWLATGQTSTLVERSSDGQQWALVTAEPVTITEYIDATAKQGQRWSYRLRAEAKGEQENRVIGDPSEVITVEFPDLYPPATPEDLVCLPEETRITIRWRSVRDAASYRIERRIAGSRWLVLAEDHPRSSFEDEDPPVGELTYRVRAVDRAGNASDVVRCTSYIGVAP